MANYRFFQNLECEYFPCHKGADPARFSCIFCYCPLYALGDRCGGHFRYTKDGIKDCSDCQRPHAEENYDAICKAMEAVLEMAKKRPENGDTP